MAGQSLRLEQSLELVPCHGIHLSHLLVDINHTIIQASAFYVILGGRQIVRGPFGISCPPGLDDRKTKDGNVRIELRRLAVTENIPGFIMVIGEFAIVLP
jgi:hypothetical protein